MPFMDDGKIINEMLDRRSVRKYRQDAVSEEDVLRVLEAARLAPSGNNTQPWRFIVIRDPETAKAPRGNCQIRKMVIFSLSIIKPRCAGLLDKARIRVYS